MTVRGFFGLLFMIAGVLMAGLCGLCGAGFFVVFLIDGLKHPEGIGMALLPLFLGGVPAVIGMGMFVGGRALWKGVRQTPDPPPDIAP